MFALELFLLNLDIQLIHFINAHPEIPPLKHSPAEQSQELADSVVAADLQRCG